jgi:hypothetical protein
MGLTAFEDEEWWDRYREVVNDDPEMSTRGHDTFDENFYIDVGDDRYLIKMYEGEVEEVVADPGIGEDWTLGIEGPREAWEEFISEVPPPHNNEILASNYRTAVRGEDGHLEITGSNKKLFQNLRPLQRTVELLRIAHNEGDY